MIEGKKKLAILLCVSMLLGISVPVSVPAATKLLAETSADEKHVVEVVSTQKKLQQALEKSGVKQIVIQTKIATSFTIPKGNYSNIKLVVRAPKAEVTNYGTFKSVSLYSISNNTFKESANNNKIRVLASSGRIAVLSGSTVDTLTIAKKSSNIKVDVDGSIKKMDVNATSNITMSGKSTDTNVVVNKAAKNTTITTAVPATVKLKTTATVALKNGAEDAKIVVLKNKGKAIDYTLENKTNATLKLKTASGTKTLASGKSYDGKSTGSSDLTIIGGGSSSSSSTSGGSSSSGSSGSNSSGETSSGNGSSGTVSGAKLAVSLYALSTNSFRVYIDTEYDLGDLDVKVTPDVGKITEEGSASCWHFYTNNKGQTEKYTCYYQYSTEMPLQRNQDYDVSVIKNGYNFEKNNFNATHIYTMKDYREDVGGVQSLATLDSSASSLELFCEDNYFDVTTDIDNVAAWTEKIKKEIERMEYEDEEDVLYGNTVIESIFVEEKLVNCQCPVKVVLENNGYKKEFECSAFFVDTSTDQGKFLWDIYELKRSCGKFIKKTVDEKGEQYYIFDKVLPYGTNVTWESNSPDIMRIEDGKGWFTYSGVDGKTVRLKVHASRGEGLDELKDIVEVRTWLRNSDSNQQLACYKLNIKGDNAVYISPNEKRGTLAVDATKIEYPYVESVEGKLSYQWYQATVPVPWVRGLFSEAILDATDCSYVPEYNDQKGTYWYYCTLQNQYGSDISMSTSDMVRISYTGDQLDKLVIEQRTYNNPICDNTSICPGVDFPMIAAQSGLLVYYRYKEVNDDQWTEGFLPAAVGTYEIEAYTLGNDTYKAVSTTFNVTIEPQTK